VASGTNDNLAAHLRRSFVSNLRKYLTEAEANDTKRKVDELDDNEGST
jgi:hypothetical protein